MGENYTLPRRPFAEQGGKTAGRAAPVEIVHLYYAPAIRMSDCTLLPVKTTFWLILCQSAWKRLRRQHIKFFEQEFVASLVMARHRRV